MAKLLEQEDYIGNTANCKTYRKSYKDKRKLDKFLGLVFCADCKSRHYHIRVTAFAKEHTQEFYQSADGQKPAGKQK